MHPDLRERMTADIRNAYTSLEQPDWSFVTRVLREQPYTDVVKALSHFCAVEDRTDTNYSVSFELGLGAVGASWTLWLSMVGRYAVVIGRETDQASGVLLPSSGVSMNMETSSRILQVLLNAEIVALDRSDLVSLTPLRSADDGTTVPVWRALFLDDEDWPWSA